MFHGGTQHIRRNKLAVGFTLLTCIGTLCLAGYHFLQNQDDGFLIGGELPPQFLRIYSPRLASLNSDAVISVPPVKRVAHGQIPPLVHLIYINNRASDSRMVRNYRAFFETCLVVNSELKYVLWFDTNIQLFLDKYYPAEGTNAHSKFLRQMALSRDFNSALRADILRYMLLETFGGIYMDLDTVCQKPMYSEYFKPLRHVCVVGNDPHIQSNIVFNKEFVPSNNFLAAPRQHVFMQQMVKHLPHLTDTKSDAWTFTGPYYVFNEMNRFLGTKQLNYSQLALNPGQIPTSNVVLTNHTLFHPNLDEPNMKRHCPYSGPYKWKTHGCAQLPRYMKWFNSASGGKEVGVVFTVYDHLGYLSADKVATRKYFFPWREYPQLFTWPPEDTL